MLAQAVDAWDIWADGDVIDAHLGSNACPSG